MIKRLPMTFNEVTNFTVEKLPRQVNLNPRQILP